MQPMPPALQEELRLAMIRFAEVAVREHPEVSVEYFEPVRMGYLKLGVGSALDTKFLVRMRGLTDDPKDGGDPVRRDAPATEPAEAPGASERGERHQPGTRRRRARGLAMVHGGPRLTEALD